MTCVLTQEHEFANDLTTQMPFLQPIRRTSRSSATQFGHRSTRIEKPRSNHTSPRTLERRKTNAGTKRYATLDDHYNMMYGISPEEEVEELPRESTRPMSWHPSTQYQNPAQPPMSAVYTFNQDWSRHSACAPDFYSLSAQNSMYTTQFPDYTAYTPSQATHCGSQDSDYSWQTHPQSYAVSSYSTPATEPMSLYLQQWTQQKQAEATYSENNSIDFLPIQAPSAIETQPVDDDTLEDSGKELVGLGLYDTPEPAFSWNSSNRTGGTGKGLKLEETWQPPEEEDEDEEGGDDASSDDGSVPELAEVAEPTQLPVSKVEQYTPTTNMDGQSFFFDEQESYTREWCYQQLKQPSMPLQDAGLGYGWL